MRLLLPLFVICLLFASCGDDAISPTGNLNHDGPNVTAPFLTNGTHEACASFFGNDLTRFNGQQVTAIEAYFLNVPTLTNIKIYELDEQGVPISPIREQDVTDLVEESSWHSFTLNNPLALDFPGIMICMEVLHTSTTNTIGCDAGPAAFGGDDYIGTDNILTTFRDLTNGEADINWNIRAVVGE